MTLFDLILKKNISSLSLVGMAKNVGKTTTLNYLIKEASIKGISIGLTSIGRDGERFDAIFGIKKPRIYVPEGSVIATVKKYFLNSDADVEIVTNTNIRTSVGEVVIGKVAKEGEIEIAGPSTVSGMKRVMSIMKKYGCELIFIDGAIDRKSFIASALVDGTILATGAAFDNDMKKVISETKFTVELFRLREIGDIYIKNQALRLIKEGKSAIITDDDYIELPDNVGLVSNVKLNSLLREDIKALVIRGAVTNNFVANIEKLRNIDVIVKNGSNIFIDKEHYYRLKSLGINFKVLDPINLIALTLNPFSPLKYSFDPEEFFDKIVSEISDVPVFDLIAGKSKF